MFKLNTRSSLKSVSILFLFFREGYGRRVFHACAPDVNIPNPNPTLQAQQFEESDSINIYCVYVNILKPSI